MEGHSMTIKRVAKRHERHAADTVMRLLAVLDARPTVQDERIREGLRLAAERIYDTADVVLSTGPR